MPKRHQAITTPMDPNPHGSMTYDPQRAVDQGYQDGYRYAVTWTFGRPVPAAVTSSAQTGHKYNAEYVTGYVDGLRDGISERDASTQAQWQQAYSHVVVGSRKTAGDENLWECPMCWTQFDPENSDFLDDDNPVCPMCHLELTARRKTAAGPVFREGRYCDPNEVVRQIGNMNVAAISGGRVDTVTDSTGEPTGINLPVAYGYSVVVYLDWNDTYTVQRCHNGNVKGEVREVYFDEVGEMAYQASCFQSNEFGGHIKGGSRQLTRKKTKMSNRRNPAPRRRRMASEMNRNLMELDQTPSAQDWWGEHGGETGHGAANVANVPTPGAANSYPQPTNTDQDSAIGENAAEEWDGQDSIDKDDDMNIDIQKVEAFQRRVLTNLQQEARRPRRSIQRQADANSTMQKGKRLKDFGQVQLIDYDDEYVEAAVLGDTGAYTVVLEFTGGGVRKIENWTCDCSYSQYRGHHLCSHAYATYYEWQGEWGHSAPADPIMIEATRRISTNQMTARRTQRIAARRRAAHALLARKAAAKRQAPRRAGRPVAPKQARRRAR